MRLLKLLEGIEYKEIVYKNEEWDREISHLRMDSRGERRNGLFFCLTGGKKDGHDYAKEAIACGAAAIVAERKLEVEVPQILVENSRQALGVISSVFYGNPTGGLSVIGVTGTNGKTTTTYMIESIFKEAGKRVGVIGTLGIRYANVEKPATLTTPDPIELQEVFAEMLLCGVEYVVMEVSAHALYYHKTAGISFRACIFTNLTQDHLDFFGSMEEYADAKRKLFSSDICPIAVLNGDEKEGRAVGEMRRAANAKTIFYGLNTPVDAFAILTDETLYGTECMLNVSDRLCRVALSLAGRHNVYNALAAAACAVELGVSSSAVARGLTKLKGVRGRLERIAAWQGADIYVDFAHTPDGLAKSLETVKGYCRGRVVCLFGCGGNRDKGKRPLMGATAAKWSDFTVLTSDNPRYEDPLDILAEVEKGFRRYSSRYVIVPDRARAIEYALAFLREGDILLVAGKGGEDYQEIMGIKYPFNDQDMVIKLLQQKGKILI